MYQSFFLKFFPFSPRSLKSKFLVTVLPPVTVSFLIISLIAGILSYQDMKKDILDRYEKDAQSYIKSLRLSLWNMNNSVVESQVNSILNNPDISGVKVVEAVYGLTFSAGDIPKDNQASDYLVFSNDIAYAPYTEIEVLGTLYLYFKTKKIFYSVFKQFLKDSLLFLILVMIVVASALFSYHQHINIPLEKLIKSIRRFDHEKTVSPVEWTVDDEIGEVISSYNGLIVSQEMGEAQLRRALEDARKANMIKGEFLANMSHEIRTPLNGIQGLAELVLDTRLDSEQKKFLNTIYLESEQLLTIINDILDFSKIEAGKMEIEKIPFNLRHTIENLCSSLNIQAEKKGIELVHYINSSAVTDLIGDPGRLRQILINLIGNSIKFTHEGEVFIAVQMTEQTDHSCKFRFSVKDTGIGIPKEKQNKIFESFSQADGSTTRKFGGTGLGITISKMLVEQMGGSIGLESKEGEGALFYFELEFLKHKGKQKMSEPSVVDFSGLTMMVVDDVSTSRNALIEHLEGMDCKTLSADSASLALDILQSCRENNTIPDVIFLDYQLLDMNGFELARTIRQIQEFKNIPLAVLTSTGGVGDGEQCRRINVNGYLIKPVSKEDLKLFISFVVGQVEQNESHEKFLITRHTLAETRRENIKVLLVEDYETNQMLATRQLENAGFHVTLASDGQKAVDLFSQNIFDIILMDIQMPKMDGYKACSLIRKLEAGTRRTPIIAMTAHAMKGYKQQCLDAGMDDYLTKPLKKEILLSTVGKWVQNTLKLNNLLPSFDTGFDNNIIARDDEPMDFEKGVNEFDGDKEFFLEVFDGFLNKVEEQISVIGAAIDNDDFTTIKNECHAIKGGAANLTAMPLSKCAFELEIMGREERRDTEKKELNKIIVCLEELKLFRKTLKETPE